ncbi:AAA family ATPase [Hydrogenobaculum acidophilum]
MIILSYLWIERYRVFNNIGINFNPNFQFSFELSKEKNRTGTLRIKKNIRNINNYFPKNQFISLIVGKNGVGKSSVFDLFHFGISREKYLLKSYFALFEDIDKKELIIFGAKVDNPNEVDNPNKHVIQLNQFNSANQPIESLEINIKLPDYKSSLFNYKELIHFENDFRNYFKQVHNLSLYYLTSDFDKFTLIDLSNESRDSYRPCEDSFYSYAQDLYERLEKLESSYKEFSCLSKFKIAISRLNHDVFVNFFSQIQFWQELDSIDENIKIPDSVILNIVNFTSLGKLSGKLEFIQNILMEKLGVKEGGFISSIKKLKPIIELKSIIYYIYTLYRDFNSKNSIKDKKDSTEVKVLRHINGIIRKTYKKIEDKDNELDEDSIADILDNLILELKQEIKIIKEENGNKVEIHYTLLKEFLEKIDKIVDNLEQIIKKYEFLREKIDGQLFLTTNAIDFAIGRLLKIDGSNEEKNTIIEIYQLFKEVSSLIRDISLGEPMFLYISTYPPLSSGQKRLINLFTNIEKFIHENKDTKNMLLLLDEPDAYLHPEWQRLLIFLITKFLKQFEDKDFHIIISTHSPFVISDIPKDNCVFLEMKYNLETKDNEAKVKPHDEISDTLAQNIYYLLTDSFFMEKGVGEYINQKLKHFLELVNEGSLSTKDEEEFKNLISMIGDKIIQSKLLDIVKNKDFYKGKFKNKK